MLLLCSLDVCRVEPLQMVWQGAAGTLTQAHCLCGAGGGQLAVASGDGSLRLYEASNAGTPLLHGSTVAVNHIKPEGCGEKITSVDVSYDGGFALHACLLAFLVSFVRHQPEVVLHASAGQPTSCWVLLALWLVLFLTGPHLAPT